jgi:ankyrin repeat protein
MNSLQTNKHGEGAIHVAAGLGQIDILKMLAAKGGNLGMVDLRGDSAIYWSARQGHEDIIKYLLSQGVHLNQQNKVTRETHSRTPAKFEPLLNKDCLKFE